MTLHLINTGIKSGRGGGGGGGHGSKKMGRRKNPYNDLLFYAMSHVYYVKRANLVEEVAARMTRLSKRILGRYAIFRKDQVDYIILDARKKRLNYGWHPMHVQKGADGIHRGYVPILIDVDDEDYELALIDDEDIVFVEMGLASSLHTIATMVRHDADGIAYVVAFREAMGKSCAPLKRFVDDARSLAEEAEDLASKL